MRWPADRRLATMISGLSSAASAAGELRFFGLAPRPRELHASLAGRFDRHAAREAGQVLAV